MQGSTRHSLGPDELSKLDYKLLGGDSRVRVHTPQQVRFIGSGHPWPSDSFQGLVFSETPPPSDWQVPEGSAVYRVPHLRLAMAAVLAFFDHKEDLFPAEIHPSAVVDRSAHLGVGVRIGAHTVIMAGAVLEAGVKVGAHSVIEPRARIGARTEIRSQVVIGHDCQVGSDCILHSGTVIGADGFGFVPRSESRPEKIPQIGHVKVGNFVEFGAHCAVDRGTLGDTLIGDGCKFDNFCHVAHNVTIGKNGIFAGGFFVSGSCKIGDHFLCGGTVAIADHVTITDHVTLGGRSTVTNDITKSGAYTGYPLEPLREGLKTIANLRALTSMRKTLYKVTQKLGLETAPDEGEST